MDISGLEDEYRLSAGKSRLVYVKPVREREPALNALLEAIRAEAVVSYGAFQDADELRRLLADDLMMLLTERFAAPPSTPSAPRPRLAPHYLPPERDRCVRQAGSARLRGITVRRAIRHPPLLRRTRSS
jgi:hypothetical protein